MISTTGLEVRAGSSLLIENASLRIAKGDRIGLVGRNGAGKTTLTRILAQETMPAGGAVHVTGTVGYLPQDPRSGNPDEIARDRLGRDHAVRTGTRFDCDARAKQRTQFDGKVAGNEVDRPAWREYQEPYGFLLCMARGSSAQSKCQERGNREMLELDHA